MRTDTAPAYASLSGARPNFIVVTGDATRKAYAWGELTMVREDDHAAGERPFYVISGELDVEAQGVVLTATARSLVLVPRGLRHRHVTTPGTRLLAIYSPGHSVSHEPTGPARESNSEAFRQIQVEAIL